MIKMDTEFLKPYGYDYYSDDKWDLARTSVVKFFIAIGGIQVWADMQEEQAFHPLPDEEQDLLYNLKL